MSENPKVALASVPRQALHQEVAVQLRQLIVEGRIAPGAKLNERALCEQLHVSRTPRRHRAADRKSVV